MSRSLDFFLLSTIKAFLWEEIVKHERNRNRSLERQSSKNTFNFRRINIIPGQDKFVSIFRDYWRDGRNPFFVSFFKKMESFWSGFVAKYKKCFLRGWEFKINILIMKTVLLSSLGCSSNIISYDLHDYVSQSLSKT